MRVPPIQKISDGELRALIDVAEDTYQRRINEALGKADVGYPNMKIEAVFDSPVKEKSPHRDLTGYSRVIFGEGEGRIEAGVTSGALVLRSTPACRIVVIPMNSSAVRIKTEPL